MHVVAVVPIIMSAGTAVLPTLVATVASVLAILFKPRELLRLFRQKPGTMSSLVLGVAVSVVALGWWITQPAKAAARTGPAPADWARVARELLEQQAMHQPASTQRVVIAATTEPAAATSARPAAGQDFARTQFDGGTSPAHLAPLWTYRPEATMFLSVPAISPDAKRIFVAGCMSDLGGYLGMLACINADTGKPVWEKFDLKGDVMKPFFSSPVVTPDGKNLLIGQGLHQDKDFALLCFDTVTGDLRWSVKTPLHIESSPAIHGDMVVIGAGAIEGADGRPTGDPGFVFAVRISDGVKLWQQAVNDAESAPVIDADGTTYIGSGFNGSAVVAIRGDTDEQLKSKNLPRIAWKTPVPFPVTGPVTLIGDLIIAGGGNSDLVHSNRNPKGQVVALNRNTGEIAWQIAPDDSVLGAMAARDGLVVCPCRTGEVLALSLKDGAVVWRSRISGKAPIVAGLALTDRHAYGLSTDGYLAVLDIKNGAILEKLFVNDAASAGSGLSAASPIVSRGRVIVASETGGLRCLADSKGGAQ